MEDSAIMWPGQNSALLACNKQLVNLTFLPLLNIFEKREVKKVTLGFAGGCVKEDHHAHASGQM